MATAITELDGTSEIATYGPPYNHTSGSAQKIGPISLQKLAGVHQPVDTAQDFVIKPLGTIPGAPRLAAALAAYQAAPSGSPGRPGPRPTRTRLPRRAIRAAPRSSYPPGNYGPVALMMSAELGLAQTGGLDGALLGNGSFYQTNYTKPLLFLSAGTYFEDLATGRAPARDPVGDDERDGQLPGAGLALALHLLVPDRAVQELASTRTLWYSL